MKDLEDLSLRQIASQLRDGALTARDLAERTLSHNHLGAYREIQEERTIAQAEVADSELGADRDHGQLMGVPISVKDLYGVPGFATFAGSPNRLPERFEAAGPVVQEALAQIAVVSGKTHTVEFAFGGVGTNPHYPTPINPWDADEHRAPGGSTSGGGVSLCEGSALLALGTDTAGSVRIPASWTGNAALKTTKGRWSTLGIVPLSSTLDTAGVLARTVDDLIVAFEALDPGGVPHVPEPPPLSNLRLGRCDTLLFDGCSPGVVEVVEDALAELGRAGATISPLAAPELDDAFTLFKLGGPVSVELYYFLSTSLPGWLDTLDKNVGSRIGDAANLPAHEYLARLHAMRSLSISVDARLRDVDVLVSPTVANTPPKLNDIKTPGRYGPQNLLCLRNTSVVSYLNLCAVTIPVGFDRVGMPVGLQLVARAQKEERLLAIAASCEGVLGSGRDRLGRPPRS